MIVYENPWFCVLREAGMHYVANRAPGGAAILPLRGEDILLLAMRRASQRGEVTLEIPRGHGETGETALQCARRELREETGHDLPAAAFRLLGHIRPDTGILSARVAVFEARIDPDARPGPRDDEAEALHFLPLAALPRLIAEGALEDGFTLAALALRQARLAAADHGE